MESHSNHSTRTEGFPQGSAGQHISDVYNRRTVTRAAFAKIGLDEFLQTDVRPTFVIDLRSHAGSNNNIIETALCNPALLEYPRLLDEIQGIRTSNQFQHADFRTWILGKKEGFDGFSFLYHGFIWSCSTVHHRYRVVSGMSANLYHAGETNPSQRRDSEPAYALLSSERSSKVPDQRTKATTSPVTGPVKSVEYPLENTVFYDWTRKEPPSNLTTHLIYARSIDWGRTSLGPMELWTRELRAAANLIMTDIQPASLFWGPDKVMIYNERYVSLIEAYHPCMGQSIFTSLKEYLNHIVPIFRTIDKSGQPLYQQDTPLFLYRAGQVEEAYFSLRWMPFLGESGQPIGCYETITETTQQIITDRQLSTFVDFGSSIANATSLADVWSLAFEALGRNEKDCPFALVYAIEDENRASSMSCTKDHTDHKTAVLKGKIGVSKFHPAAFPRLPLKASPHGFAPYFREVLKHRQLMVLHIHDGSLPQRLVQGLTSQYFGDPIRSVAIAPITPTGNEVVGFFVIGCNPRRPFDSGVESYISAIARILATSMASVVLIEQQAFTFSKTISEKQRMIDAHERKFQRFADRANVGIAITTSEGDFTYRNDRWFDLFHLCEEERALPARDAWKVLVAPEHIHCCEQAWETIRVEQVPVSFELRLNRTWNVPEQQLGSALPSEEQKTWVLASIYPELRDDGSVESIVTCVTDISHLKWSERIQQQRTEDALYSKRQLENFIDTTSHEFRNPLSAMTHCGDGLLATAQDVYATYPTIADVPLERKELLDTIVDYAHTIIQCASHQRRIVDDVLVMSKMESGCLAITPIDIQPVKEIQHVLKMFEAEASEAKVEMQDLVVDDTYRALDIGWVLLDPTRVAQILINLITNAIKFTRFEETRRIEVTVSASSSQPRPNSHGVMYFQASGTENIMPSATDVGEKETVYIIITVQDTGRGLTSSEKDLLFRRFSQASVRTHIQYGGNGLGLYISRRLAELQGGAIGFSSKSGSGSTFSFYVKARRCTSDTRQQSLVLRRLSENDPNLTKSNNLQFAPTPSTAVPVSTVREGQNFSSVNLSILVVEDNIVNQKVLAKQLRKLGCIVEVANHGAEALSYIETTDYWAALTNSPKKLSVVLLDWEMPVMDGLTCVRKIRELQQKGAINRWVPVVGTTANARTEQIAIALKAGMDDIVSKPFHVPDLLTRINTLL
ncbi:hypothetical protein EJ08DRAFT_612368, partial [Tothia fuscella]